jgi:hypothetical protein
MQSLSDQTEPDLWPQIMPLLEEAMGRLGDKDRNALALRFFEGKSFQEIGKAFGASENAAKKRVAYALEKLRVYFSKCGVTSTTTTIAGAICANSVQAAPATLAKTVSAMALAKGGVSTGATLLMVKGAMNLTTWAKFKTAVVAALMVSTAGIATVVATKMIMTTSSRIPQTSNTGYETPEAALHTAFAAMSAGDTAKWLDSFSPFEQEAMKNKFGRTDRALKAATASETRLYSNVRFGAKEVVSEDEVHVHLQLPAPQPEIVLLMKRIGGKWKVAGELSRTN